MHLYEIRGLNFKILKLFVETSEPNGMKNLAIQNRVLQRDRVLLLERRVLERDYCTGDRRLGEKTGARFLGINFQDRDFNDTAF